MTDNTHGMHTELLKSDALGHIEIVTDGALRWIRRDTRTARFGMRWIARAAAAREARVLGKLSGVNGVPQLIAWQGGVLDRSFMDGAPMQRAQPSDPAFYRAAHRLLKQLRERGVVHNDLAKEPNWLQRLDGSPAVVDFQIAWARQRGGSLFRLLAREDLRHLLKHKRTYCPQCVTATERRVLARRSWIANAWKQSGKRLYKLVARRLFGYWDNEGKGRVRD
ncbi:MAG: serine/threonine protein kinase [Dokdonella sp.]